MGTGSNAIRDFELLAQSNNINLGDIAVYYQNNNNTPQWIYHCKLFIDMYSSDWSISIDSANAICFERFTTVGTFRCNFTFNKNTKTLKISGTDRRNQSNIPYSISITL